jgi:pyridoxal/pyridoxine/pyridoxamine kinase
LSQMAWKQNASVNAANKYDASALQIVYGGTGTVYMDGGNNQSAATIYAPNANFILKGTQDLYGSILAKTILNEGDARIHYDRRLNKDFYVAGHPMAGTFSWKRY